MQEPDPPVGRIRTPLYQPEDLKLVDDAAKRDRLDFQQLRQATLVDAFMERQIRENLPLRARQVGAASVSLKAPLQQPGDFVQQKSKRRGILFHGPFHS